MTKKENLGLENLKRKPYLTALWLSMLALTFSEQVDACAEFIDNFKIGDAEQKSAQEGGELPPGLPKNATLEYLIAHGLVNTENAQSRGFIRLKNIQEMIDASMSFQCELTKLCMGGPNCYVCENSNYPDGDIIRIGVSDNYTVAEPPATSEIQENTNNLSVATATPEPVEQLEVAVVETIEQTADAVEIQQPAVEMIAKETEEVKNSATWLTIKTILPEDQRQLIETQYEYPLSNSDTFRMGEYELPGEKTYGIVLVLLNDNGEAVNKVLAIDERTYDHILQAELSSIESLKLAKEDLKQQIERVNLNCLLLPILGLAASVFIGKIATSKQATSTPSATNRQKGASKTFTPAADKINIAEATSNAKNLLKVAAELSRGRCLSTTAELGLLRNRIKTTLALLKKLKINNKITKALKRMLKDVTNMLYRRM